MWGGRGGSSFYWTNVASSTSCLLANTPSLPRQPERAKRVGNREGRGILLQPSDRFVAGFSGCSVNLRFGIFKLYKVCQARLYMTGAHYIFIFSAREKSLVSIFMHLCLGLCISAALFWIMRRKDVTTSTLQLQWSSASPWRGWCSPLAPFTASFKFAYNLHPAWGG